MGPCWDNFAVQRRDCESPTMPKPAAPWALNILSPMISLAGEPEGREHVGRLAVPDYGRQRQKSALIPVMELCRQ